jgi:hypothetical protein
MAIAVVSCLYPSYLLFPNFAISENVMVYRLRGPCRDRVASGPLFPNQARTLRPPLTEKRPGGRGMNSLPQRPARARSCRMCSEVDPERKLHAPRIIRLAPHLAEAGRGDGRIGTAPADAV